jgi:hypothetical protein
MGGQGNTRFEQVKRSFVELTSEMRCPHHFKNATVEMDGENLDDLSVEVISCCDEFQKRIGEALDNLVAQQSLIVAPALVITTPNTGIKYSRPNLPVATTAVSIVPAR